MFHPPARRFAVTTCCAAMLLSACAGVSKPQPSAPINATPTVSAPSSTALSGVHADAEQIFWKINALDVSHFSSGNYVFPEAEMRDLATDPYLSSSRKDYAEFDRLGITVKHLDKVQHRITPSEADDSRAEVVLMVCYDSSPVEFYVDGKLKRRGSITMEKNYFAKENGQLKLYGVKSKEVVACEN